MTNNHTPEPEIRSGYIALAGRPNAGKSTLLNCMSGMYLAIVSPKPQTTRSRVTCILDTEDTQMIFVDTPGLHRPQSKLGQHMQETAWKTMLDADITALIVDVQKPGPTYAEKETVRRCAAADVPVILLLNKVDAISKEKLLPIIGRYSALGSFTEIIPISAKTGDGVDVFLNEIRKRLPDGPRYYPKDSLTNQTERSLTAELIREQILLQTEQEIPHGIGIRVEEFQEIPDAENRERVSIRALIYCEKDSHKKILIGRRGSMLTSIGTAARLRIEEMTGCPVYLELLIKVRENWRNRKGILEDLGYGG